PLDLEGAPLVFEGLLLGLERLALLLEARAPALDVGAVGGELREHLVGARALALEAARDVLELLALDLELAALVLDGLFLGLERLLLLREQQVELALALLQVALTRREAGRSWQRPHHGRLVGEVVGGHARIRGARRA